MERSTNKIKSDNETLIVDLSTNSTPDVSMELEGNIIQSVAEMENPEDIVMETIPTETPIVGDKVIPPSNAKSFKSALVQAKRLSDEELERKFAEFEDSNDEEMECDEHSKTKSAIKLLFQKSD